MEHFCRSQAVYLEGGNGSSRANTRLNKDFHHRDQSMIQAFIICKNEPGDESLFAHAPKLIVKSKRVETVELTSLF